jgi:hypothetical protein
MPLTLCRKRFDGSGLGFETSSDIYHIFGQIATMDFTLVLKSIQREVESRESIDNGSGLGVFLPGRREKQGCFRRNRKIRRNITC